jgi:spore germination cell wall hydrolase CwlJ-like protein
VKHHSSAASHGRGTTILNGVLAAIAGCAILGPALVVANAPIIEPAPKVAAPRQRVVPKAELPPVEPVAFVDLAPQDARAFNATVPFSTEPNPAARPFTFEGPADDLARATDCLAAAVLYEAGDDAVGEKAVAQVILNRLHHPAFPKTVCGVVFEGSERTTGCQFTFACDGALIRRPSEPGWIRAREIAAAALSGSVYKPVGYATHYHTAWVVPYWQSSLDKVAAVHTHLFFRWTGWWGTPPAFNRHVLSGEPVIAKLAGLSDAHGLATAVAAADEANATLAAMSLNTRGLAPLPTDPNSFLTTIDPRQPPESFQALALKACGDRPRCKVMGWSEPGAMGFALPLNDEQIAALSFSYLRDRDAKLEKTLWNCAEFPRKIPAQCMKRQVMRATPVAAPVVAVPEQPLAGPIPELNGVRRKQDTATRAVPATAPVAAIPKS